MNHLQQSSHWTPREEMAKTPIPPGLYLFHLTLSHRREPSRVVLNTKWSRCWQTQPQILQPALCGLLGNCFSPSTWWRNCGSFPSALSISLSNFQIPEGPSPMCLGFPNYFTVLGRFLYVITQTSRYQAYDPMTPVHTILHLCATLEAGIIQKEVPDMTK